MTITVQGPGGVSIAFPDGTSAETIGGVMSHHFPDHSAPEDKPASPIGAMDLALSATDLPVISPLWRKAVAAGHAALGSDLKEPTFKERYDHALANLEEPMQRFREEHPIAAGLSNAAGTVAATLPMAATATGAKLLGLGGESLLGQIGRGAASGGAINASDAGARGNDPLAGGMIGAAIGGAGPIAARAVGAALSPLISNVASRADPAGTARAQVVRAMMEAGKTPAEIETAIRQAAGEGQSMFTAADAMGNAGQRMLSTVARAPGAGRTAVVDALESRQAGQGRRVANTLAEGFQAPETAAATEARMTGARDALADTEYGAARQGANPVDVTPVLRNIDSTLQPGVNQIARPASGIANDSIESALQSVRARLTDGRSNLTDFTALQRVRGDLSDMAQSAQRAGQGNRARLLGGVLRQMDASMEAASPGFQKANRNFSQASKDIEAIGTGRNAAMRGRPEDTIPAFQGLRPQGQAGFRAGYVDPLIEAAQSAAPGVNKARPLLNDAFREEAAAMTPRPPMPDGATGIMTVNGQQYHLVNGGMGPLVQKAPGDLMMNRIGRENTMFETRQQALGGSRTADNLADAHAMGIDPALAQAVGHTLSGNMMGALKSVLSAGSNALTGNTAQVREQVAKILLANGQNMEPGALQRVLDRTMKRIETIRKAQQALTRAGSAALTAQTNR